MGDILVRRGTVEGGRIRDLEVGFHGLPDRTIDRETAIAWMRDGHSLVPLSGGSRLPPLQLVELDEGYAIRTDNRAETEDALPAAVAS